MPLPHCRFRQRQVQTAAPIPPFTPVPAVAQAAPVVAKTAPAAAKGKSGFPVALLIVVMLLIVIAAAGAGYWFFLRPAPARANGLTRAECDTLC